MDLEIKLSREKRDIADGIHGYYASLAGRNFLKNIYRQYRETTQQTDGRIASFVADDSRDQLKEIAATKQALARWSTGQSDLWADEEKAMRIARRLELTLIKDPRVASLCNDQAAGIRRKDFAYALDDFFQPWPKVDRAEPSLHGFEGQELLEDSDDLLGFFQMLYPLHDHPTVPPYAASGDYCRMSRVEYARGLLVQEFRLGSGGVLMKRRCGFAYPTHHGTVVKFMMSYSSPNRRWMETARRRWRREGDDFLARKGLTGRDLPFISDVEPRTAQCALEHLNLWPHREYALRPVDGDLKRFMDSRFSSLMWDIPL